VAFFIQVHISTLVGPADEEPWAEVTILAGPPARSDWRHAAADWNRWISARARFRAAVGLGSRA
jgi:hypothetical protein